MTNNHRIIERNTHMQRKTLQEDFNEFYGMNYEVEQKPDSKETW